MKKTLVIVAHPNPDSSHTQQFLMETARFDATITLKQLAKPAHAEDLTLDFVRSFDRLIFQFPVYWYSLPYLLKQWLDQTLLFGDKSLKDKELGLVPCFDTKEKHYQAGGRERFTISEMFRPIEMLANHLEMDYLPPFSIFQFNYLSQEAKRQLMVDYLLYLTGPKNITFKEKGQWLVANLQKGSRADELLLEQILSQQETIEALEQALEENI